MDKVKVRIVPRLNGAGEQWMIWVPKAGTITGRIDVKGTARQMWVDTCAALGIPDDRWEFVEADNG